MTVNTAKGPMEPDTADDAAKMQMEQVIKATLQQMQPPNNTQNNTAILVAGIALITVLFQMADGWGKFRVVEAAVSDIKTNMAIMQGDIKTLLGTKK